MNANARLALLSVLLAGCTAVSVKRTPMPSGSAEVDGLAVSLAQPHRLITVFPQEQSGGDIVAFEGRALLPSETEMYVVGYTGFPLYTTHLEVDLQPDSTLKRVASTSESKVQADLTGVAGAVTDLGTSIKAYQASLKPSAQPNAVDQQNADLRRKLLNQMLQANVDAIAKGQPLPYPELKDYLP